MQFLRTKTEAFFEWWSELVIRHPWRVILVLLLATCAILPQLRHGRVDVSTEAYLPKGDPALEIYDDFREQFGYGSFGNHCQG